MNTRIVTITTLMGIVLAGLGIVAPILWDLYKGRSQLELQHISSITLIEGNSNIEKLQILYAGKPIKSITKLVFSLVNSGKTAIVQEQLKNPPTIYFGENAEILDVKVQDKYPDSVELNCNTSEDKKSIILTFPLLNASDRVDFSVLLSGQVKTPLVSARIVNVKELKFLDISTIERKSKLSWTIYVVGAFSAFLVFIVLSLGLSDLRKEMETRRIFKSPDFNIPIAEDKAKYQELIRTYFSSRTEKELKPIKEQIDKITTSSISIEDHEAVINAMRAVASKSTDTIGAIFFCLLLAGIGIYYIIDKLYL